MSDKKWIQSAVKRMKKKGTVGSFTEYCGGKVTDDCIKRGLASRNAAIRKRANFARNVKKKEAGGPVDAIIGNLDGSLFSDGSTPIVSDAETGLTNMGGLKGAMQNFKMDFQNAGGAKGIGKAAVGNLKDLAKGFKPSMGQIVNLGAQALAKRAENKAGAVSMADPYRNNEMERKSAKRRGFGTGFQAAADSAVGQALGKVPVVGKGLQALAGVAGGLFGKKKAEKQQEKDRKEAVKQLRTSQQAQLAQQAAQAKQFETSGETGYAGVGSVANSYLAQRGMRDGGVYEGKRLKGGKTKPLPGGAVEFIGKKHSQGGIMLDAQTEVEGGETMDKVQMKKKGGKTSDYIFSDYLKLGGKTFAQRHKELKFQNASQEKIQQLAKLQEKKAGRTPKVMQFGGVKQYETGGEDEPRPNTLSPDTSREGQRTVLTMGMFRGPRGEGSGEYVGSTSDVNVQAGKVVKDSAGATAKQRDQVKGWSQNKYQEETGDNLFSGVTEKDVEDRVRDEAHWFNPNDPKFGEGGFDVHKKEHVEIYQQMYNDEAPEGQKVKVDGKWGDQTQSATIPKKTEPAVVENTQNETEVEIIDPKPEPEPEPEPEEEPEPEPEPEEEIEYKDVKTKEVPTIATIGGLAQLIPPMYAFKTQPAYITGPGAASVVAPNMPRVNLNAERSANANDFRSTMAAIEGSGGGPANMVNMLVGLERKQNQDREIANAENRANKELAAEEKRMKLSARETNARLGLEAGQFAAGLAREQIRDRREEKLGALDAMADRLAGLTGDVLSYKAQERYAKEIGADGIYEAQRLREMGYDEDQITAILARSAQEKQDEENVQIVENRIKKEKAEKPNRGRRIGRREEKRILADEAAQEAGFEDAKDREQQRKDFEKRQKALDKRDRRGEGEEQDEPNSGGISLLRPDGTAQEGASTIKRKVEENYPDAEIGAYQNANGDTIYYPKLRKGGYIRRAKAARRRRKR